MRDASGVRRWAVRGAWGVWIAVAVIALGFPVQEVLASAEPHGFDTLRRALDGELHRQGKGVPMMWAVSLAARGFTGGGVRGLRVVQYEGLPEEAFADRVALEQTVRRELGAEWSPMVRERSEGETSLVYVQPAGKNVRMIVMDLEGRELNLVRMELSPEALARWEREHAGW